MHTRLEVRLVRERPSTHDAGSSLRSPADIYRSCRDLQDADRERFLVLHLDPGLRLVAREEVAVGTLDRTLLTSREVFKGAILANSAAIVLVHNHPSGDPSPSAEDIRITRYLVEVGRWLGIPVLDHVIVGRDDFESLSAQDLLDG